MRKLILTTLIIMPVALFAQSLEKITSFKGSVTANYDILASKGNYLYTIYDGGSTSTLVTFDISNRAAPVQVSSLGFDDAEVYDLALTDNRLYVAGRKLSIFNITNPAAPALSGQPADIIKGSDWQSIDVANDIMIISDTDDLQIYDISNPDSPLLKKHITEGLFDIWQQGGVKIIPNTSKAWLIRNGGKFHQLDFTNPAAFTLSSVIYEVGVGGGLAGGIPDFHIVGDFIVGAADVLSGNDYYFSINTTTSQVTTTALPGTLEFVPPTNVALNASNEVAVFAGDIQFYALNISNPAVSTEIGLFPEDTDYSLFVDDYLYALDGNEIAIYQLGGTSGAGEGETTQTNASDSLALVALYNATNGPGWTNKTEWLSGPVSNWHGVTVANNRVTEVKLQSNNLSGTIPSDLGNLSNLQILYLYSNTLTGSIPTTLGNLDSLTELILHTNQLSGSIPQELGSLSKLKDLRLSYNQLTGALPTALFNLTNLEVLYLGNNSLSGAIPSQIGILVNLKELYLGECEFTGAIPTQIGNLVNLDYLDLYENQLSGTIPTVLSSLSKLEYLYLGINQLTGTVPVELANLSNLKRLYLNSNQLTGTIPTQFGQLTAMERLVLGSNQLTGTIPTTFANLVKLETLSLYDNQLTGSMPGWLGQLSVLKTLSLRSNQLSGQIPSEIGQLDSLQFISIRDNQLTGEIPASLGNLSTLQELYIYDNQLEGAIPSSFTQLSQLNSFYFYNTDLCEPSGAAYQSWKNGVADYQGTDLVCEGECVDCLIVTTTPENPTDNEEITIIYDATVGDTELVGANKVYIYSGLVTDALANDEWEYVIGSLDLDDGIGEMTKVQGETDKWQITVDPQDYYGAPEGTTFYRIGMIFRNEDGTKTGKDYGGGNIFVDVTQEIPNSITNVNLSDGPFDFIASIRSNNAFFGASNFTSSAVFDDKLFFFAAGDSGGYLLHSFDPEKAVIEQIGCASSKPLDYQTHEGTIQHDNMLYYRTTEFGLEGFDMSTGFCSTVYSVPENDQRGGVNILGKLGGTLFLEIVKNDQGDFYYYQNGALLPFDLGEIEAGFEIGEKLLVDIRNTQGVSSLSGIYLLDAPDTYVQLLSGSSYFLIPNSYAFVGGNYYFFTDGPDGVQFWKSNGTISGTTVIGNYEDRPVNAFNVDGDYLLFNTDPELWKYDFSSSELLLLSEEVNLNRGSNGFESLFNYDRGNNNLIFSKNERPSYAKLNDKVWFTSRSVSTDHDLWFTDGTVEGTTKVQGSDTTNFEMFVFEFNGFLFSASSSSSNTIKISDGTAANTIEIVAEDEGFSSYSFENSPLSFGFESDMVRLGNAIYLEIQTYDPISGSTSPAIWRINPSINLDNVSVPEENIISAVQPDSKITVYPNPTQRILQIDGLSIDKYEIYDIGGRLIVQETNTLFQNTIDVSKLSEGIYILGIYNGSQMTKHRFVKDAN